MAIPEIKIKIGADSSALTKDLGTAQTAVTTFARAAEASGSQIGDSFDRAGARVRTTLRDMASTAISSIGAIVGPAALVSAAVTAAFAGISAYIASMSKEIPDVDETLRRHNALIKEIKASYETASEGVRQYGKDSDEVLVARNRANIIELQGALKSLATDTVSAFSGAVPATSQWSRSLDLVVGGVVLARRELIPFGDALNNLNMSIRAGTPDVTAFREQVAAVMNAAADNKSIQQLGNELLKMSEKAQTSAAALREARNEIDGTANASRRAAEDLNRFTLAVKALDGISPKEKSKRYQIDEEYLRARLGVVDENKLRELARARDDAIARVNAEEEEKNKAKGGGRSGGRDNTEAEAEAERARIQSRLEIIRQGLMTREQMEAEYRAKDEAIIAEAFQKKIISEQEKNTLLEQMKAEHLAKMQAMEAAAQQKGVDLVVKGGKALASAFEGNSKRMAGVAKTFGAVEALINAFRAFNQVLADPSLPWFAKFGAAASVLAAGMQTVNAIKSISSSGGSGARGGGGGGYSGGGATAAPAQAAQAERSMYVTIQGSTLGREQMREFIDQANGFFKDGGGKLVLGGA